MTVPAGLPARARREGVGGRYRGHASSRAGWVGGWAKVVAKVG